MSDRAPLDGSGVEPHVFAGVVENDPDLRENVLRFAADHDLTVTFSPDHDDPEGLDALLGELRAYGLDFMMNTGQLGERSSAELAAGGDALDELCERTMRTVDVYADHYPDGRVYLWHEAPLFENWVGDDQDEQAESIADHGPAIFAAQKATIQDRYPGIDVGVFVHNPYMAPSSHTKTPIFGRLMDGLRDRDALPEFTYCDMYRGYYEWEAGYEGVNEYLRAVLENAREQTGGRPVHYLGEAHTINNNYTPSKQSILGNLRTAVDTGVAGYGWYLRGNYRRTHRRNYNPFLPNEGEVDEQQFTSFTGSRDRLLWAFLCLLGHTGYDPADYFDLWVHGRDLRFHEHRVSLARDGEWAFAGDVSGYPDGDNPYAGAGRDRVCVLRGLDRSHLAGGLDVRIDSEGAARLHGVYALPHFDAAAFVPEAEATDLLDGVDAGAFALGHDATGRDLRPGTATELSVPVDDPDRPPDALPTTPPPETLDRLRGLAADDPPSALFDLWVYGDRLADARIDVAGDDVTGLADRPDAPGEGQAVVVRGLDKEEYYDVHRLGSRLDVAVETGGRVAAAYVMPHGGQYNVGSPGETAATVEAEYADRLGQIDQFAIGSAAWPPAPDRDSYEAEIQCVHRRLVERTEGSDITV
ncbi:MAG: hypothetical protein ABEH77_05490 [Halobacteriaceae archaeon]